MRPDIEQAIERAKANGGHVVMQGGALKHLEKILASEEKVLLIAGANAMISKGAASLKAPELSDLLAMKAKGKTPGLFVVTNSRILFIQSLLLQKSVDQMVLSMITGVKSKTDSLNTTSVLRVESIAETIDVDLRPTFTTFALNTINELIANVHTQQTAARSTQMPASAPPKERLEKLKALRDEGLVTVEEYDAQRSRIISEL